MMHLFPRHFTENAAVCLNNKGIFSEDFKGGIFKLFCSFVTGP